MGLRVDSPLFELYDDIGDVLNAQAISPGLLHRTGTASRRKLFARDPHSSLNLRQKFLANEISRAGRRDCCLGRIGQKPVRCIA